MERDYSMLYSNALFGSKKGKTKEQINALCYYRFCLMEEDRYMGSVFYKPGDKREKELLDKTAEAFRRCQQLGVGKYC